VSQKPQPCPTCGKKDPPDGCSHIECPNRKPVTAHPKRVGDGLIPPRGSGSRNH
jgi:hypothetical protein